MKMTNMTMLNIFIHEDDYNGNDDYEFGTLLLLLFPLFNLIYIISKKEPCHWCPPAQSLRSRPTDQAPRSYTAVMDPGHSDHHHLYNLFIIIFIMIIYR